MRRRHIGIAIAAALLAVAAAADAKTIELTPGGGLVEAVAAAEPGDVLHLAPGLYRGPVVIDKSLTIEGNSSETTIVEGNGKGSVIRILSPHVTIRRLDVRGSGTDSTGIDAGIYVELGADAPEIEGNRIEGNLFGITLHGPKDARVRGNFISNRNDLWLNNRGNGIHMWNNAGALIDGNAVTGGRDGIFIQLGHDNVITGNHFQHLRFAIHFMYSKRGSILANTSFGDHVGYALMYSDNLKVEGNLSLRDRDYGLMLNSANKALVQGNFVYGTEDRCLFLYLSERSRIEGNRFEGCGIGVHVTGSDSNAVSDNAFVENRVQMHYAGTKLYEWSQHGRGNYWSDNTAFDLNGDGIADTAYRPNNVVDWIVWRYPLARLLLSSPSMEILRASQGQFPALFPGGVVDSFPLMAPDAPPLPLPQVPAKVEWEKGQAEPAS